MFSFILLLLIILLLLLRVVIYVGRNYVLLELYNSINEFSLQINLKCKFIMYSINNAIGTGNDQYVELRLPCSLVLNLNKGHPLAC